MARWINIAAVLVIATLALGVSGSADKVKVELYAESLCPYCARFTTKIISKLFANNVASIMDFTYVPWGNAKLINETSQEVSCQHGRRECLLNTLFSCVIDTLPEQKRWFPIVECIERSAFSDDNVLTLLEKCSSESSRLMDGIKTCFQSDKGQKLQMEAYNKTAALQPPHKWVPWVVVNGVPLFDAYEDVQAIVCAAYEGEDRPKACFTPTPEAPAATFPKKYKNRKMFPKDIPRHVTTPDFVPLDPLDMPTR